MEYYSSSKLTAHRDCPRKYHEKPPSDPFSPTDALDFGTAIHAALAAHFAGGDFIGTFTRVALEVGAPVDTDRAARALQAVQDRRNLRVDPDSIIAIESQDATSMKYGKPIHQVVLADGADWGVEGMLDLVDVFDDEGQSTLRITDWKTGFSAVRDDLQLALYALLGWKVYGFDRIRTGFFYLDKRHYEYSNWDENSLVGAWTYVSGLVNKLRSDREWPERPNVKCGYCEIRANCKTFSRMMTQVPAPDRWDVPADHANIGTIISLLGQVEAQKKAVCGIEARLKERRNTLLLEKNDVVVDGVVHHAFEYTTTYQYDIERLFTQAANVLGRSPFEVLSLDAGAFDDLAAAQTDPTKRRALADLKKECRHPVKTAVKVSTKIDKTAEPTYEETTEVPPTTEASSSGAPTAETPSTASGPAAPMPEVPSQNPPVAPVAEGANGSSCEAPAETSSPTTASNATNATTAPVKRQRGPYLVCLACGDYETEKKPANRCPCGGQEFVEVKTKNEAVQVVASKVTPLKSETKQADLAFTLCNACGQVHADRPDAIATECRTCGSSEHLSREKSFVDAMNKGNAIKTRPPAPANIYTICWNCGHVHADSAPATVCQGCGDSGNLAQEPSLFEAEKNSREIKIALGEQV